MTSTRSTSVPRTEAFARPDADTVLAGFPVGLVPPLAPVDRPGRPADVLVDLVAERLTDEPCFVEFSGGCDSSLLLGVAVEACRRAGHAPPIPITDRYDDPATHETDYQELVIQRLGLRDWIVRRPDREADLLGPLAQELLRRHGVLWPAPLAGRRGMFATAGRGLMLSGQGGDEVLGARRVTPLVEVLRAARHREGVGRALRRARPVLSTVGARRAASYATLEAGAGLQWLRGDHRRRAFDRLVDEAVREPLDPARAMLDWHLRRRSLVDAHGNLRALAAEHDVDWFCPFWSVDLATSLARHTRWHHYRGRNHLLARHFAHLLPPELVRRTSKAYFNGALFGPESRAFAARWDGTGVDPDVVDVAWLRDNWRSDLPFALTSLLLQQAWLATEGRSA